MNALVFSAETRSATIGKRSSNRERSSAISAARLAIDHRQSGNCLSSGFDNCWSSVFSNTMNKHKRKAADADTVLSQVRKLREKQGAAKPAEGPSTLSNVREVSEMPAEVVVAEIERVVRSARPPSRFCLR